MFSFSSLELAEPRKSSLVLIKTTLSVMKTLASEMAIPCPRVTGCRKSVNDNEVKFD